MSDIHWMMERRSKRVSASQWEMILEFLESNSSLARGYNNTARGREQSQRLWRELSNLLNAEGSGATKTRKEWATGPSRDTLEALVDERNLHQTLEIEELQEISLPNRHEEDSQETAIITDVRNTVSQESGNDQREAHSVTDNSLPISHGNALPLHRRPRRVRLRTRPMAPINEARRIMSEVEMQRGAADAASARALDLIGQNLGRLAAAAERYLYAHGL